MAVGADPESLEIEVCSEFRHPASLTFGEKDFEKQWPSLKTEADYRL